MSNLSLYTRRNPFTEMDSLVRALTRPAAVTSPVRPAAFTPAAEIAYDGNDAVIRIEIPGVDADKDVSVEVDGTSLTIRGERRDERTQDKGPRTVREMRYGSFRRTFRLPERIDADTITAAHDNGILTVRVPGILGTTPTRRIPITAKAADASATEPTTAETPATEPSTAEDNA
ncbi:Hsp20/alpha crystallin family protein [Streptomyces sp. NPDC002519]